MGAFQKRRWTVDLVHLWLTYKAIWINDLVEFLVPRTRQERTEISRVGRFLCVCQIYLPKYSKNFAKK